MKKINLDSNEKIEKISGKLKVLQNNQLPKFGIDAFLIANFIDKSKSQRLLLADFGAGTGIIGLLYAIENPGKVFLIDNNSQLSQLEEKTVGLNDLKKRVTVINQDINNLDGTFQLNSLDVIVSNPPYFDSSNYSKKNLSKERSHARHEENFDLAVLVSQSKKFLKSRGKLYFIYRAERIADFIDLLIKNGFGISKMRFVYGKKNTGAKLVLVKAIKQGSNAKINIEKPMIIFNERNEYTKELQNILHDNKYFFYVIQTADNYLYAGTSDDVNRRFATHQAKKGAKFTRAAIRHPLKLVYQEEFSSKSEALSFEAKFKHLSRIEKERYIGL
ncbi:putative bifunctional fused protein; tRNA1(Val) (adenine(37)-N6)-methyltransferase; UvrC-Intron-type (URI) endonuclease [Oenococcus oeni]|uniref:GIY-YIG nuclease family protein n=1 Tax=Oenococcus oeni TaxID=1247 RepID=UPI0010AFB4B9|nr:GIY-YIG nuclease family protein [Oenococcus oeni]SYV99796.1 putative bifunctional fused protein; tRNA1(Val) (adenine(37)-N6)-methyltransferase; UvrC-Intron-type (URI) endonuclease [Oenococcus oeni]